MVVRYMGTKRHMADHVRDAIVDLAPDGRVVDLFSGMGSVAECLRDTSSVVTNDAFAFAASLSRARFLGAARDDEPPAVAARLAANFNRRRAELERDFQLELADESQVLGGARAELASFMESAKHAGNSPTIRRRATRAAEASDSNHYQLATLYFASGYVGVRQAIEIDAIRFAIDHDLQSDERDWLLGAWITAVSAVINAPGHTAQFLKPNTAAGHARIVKSWTRSIWDEFALALKDLDQVGTAEWRAKNAVFVGDALDLVGGGALEDIGAVYADPPYTKDQYSRYYHVYETLYRYDFPNSSGAGRTRSDRFSTGFCLKSSVVASFQDLCRNVSRMDVPLVISYPSAGLLTVAGGSIPDIAGSHFSNIDTLSFSASHSTMGASSGNSKKTATENLFVCTNK